MATITLTVTVSNPGSGNRYYIDGALQATVSAIPGNTYKFDQADNSNSGHPLRLSTTSNGSHNSGSEYTTGVTTSGTPGSAGAYTQIEVTALTVQTLYYYCTQHSGMGGSFNVGNSSTLGLKEMSGFPIQNLTADPVPFAQAKTNDPYAGTWSSGGALNSGRSLLGGFGSTTGASANIVFGGDNPGGPSPSSNYAITESYNGTAWTEVNDLNTGRASVSGLGTTTAGFAIGGNYSGAPAAGSNNVESWNGSSWTETTEINSARIAGVATGITTSGLFSTGTIPGSGTPSSQTLNESWNGSAWTEVGDLNQARRDGAGSGTTNTAALVFGGRNPPANTTGLATNELWNGSSWTETGDLNLARMLLSGSGSSTAALAFAGNNPTPGRLTQTEIWDGTSWTEVAELANARMGAANGTLGSSISSLATGGETTLSPDTQTVTEEWAFTGINPTDPAVGYSDAIVGQMYYNSTSGSFKAIKDGVGSGTWSSGGNMNTARYRMFGGFAPHSEGLVAGGQAPVKANVENYNGTSWTEVADIPSALSDSGMIGVYTAGVLAGGEGSSGSTTEALHWNGSAWTEATNMPVSLERCSGSGVQTAGMITGGRNPGASGGAATNLEYDGTNWTTGGSIPVGTYNIAVQGPQTAAIAAGGVKTGEGAGTASAYTYDGSSWTVVSSLNTARYESGWATQGEGSTRALVFGGNDSPARPTTEFWDGSSWTELNDLSTGRAAGGSFGGVNNAVYAGGSPPTMATTEEWTQADFDIKTLTTS